MSKTIPITNGPSREELFDALRLLAEGRLVPFCVEKDGNKKYVAVLMSSIAAEDGSGQSWNLTFSINQLFLSDSFFTNKPEKIEGGVFSKKINFEGFRNLCEENYLTGEFRKNLITVKCYYSTRTREGVITVE